MLTVTAYNMRPKKLSRSKSDGEMSLRLPRSEKKLRKRRIAEGVVHHGNSRVHPIPEEVESDGPVIIRR